MTAAIFGPMATLMGKFMMAGMAVSAVVNASIAASDDYDEMCAQSDKYREAINQMNGFVTQMDKKWADLGAEIEGFSKDSALATRQLRKVLADSKQKHKKILKRTHIMASMSTSLISLLFLLKVYLKDI